MLCLSEQDIANSATFNEIREAVEEAMVIYERGDYYMPQRMHLDYNGNTLLLMPCFKKNGFSTKLVTVFPENQKKELPVIQGTVILNDIETGKPLALFNGAKLTALRTGAVGAVGIKYLTSVDISSLGIVGAGVQGIHQAMFACSQRDISEIHVYDTNHDRLKIFTEQIRLYYPSLRIHFSESSSDLVQNSQVVITATTSDNPVIPDDKSILAGKQYIGIGSFKPEMREFPEVLFNILDHIFVDTDFAMKESGDLTQPLENGWIEKSNISTLGKLIIGKENVTQGATLLFKSVGMALFDLVVSQLIYQKAKEKKLGTTIKL